MDDVIAFIKHDHDRIEKALKKDAVAPTDDIVTHLTLESQVVYPEVRDEVGGGAELDAQHKKHVAAIREALETDAVRAAFAEHVKFEEAKVLPALEKSLDAKDLERLGAELAEFKAKLSA